MATAPRHFRQRCGQGLTWLQRRWRALVLCLVAILSIACLFKPMWPLSRHVYRYLFVLDITQSMNAQDYHAQGFPSDRLGYAKAALLKALHELPCGSEAGLGVFTTQTVHTLFEPLEICEHFPVIDDALSHIDWRMAWSADSHIETGLYHALRTLKKSSLTTRLVFLTDGQETPPEGVQAQYDGKPGDISGLLVGVGGIQPVTVPRYNQDNQMIGYWENEDIDIPPISTTVYSEKTETRTLPRKGPYLSWLDEPRLKKLAAITGLRYLRLEDPGVFTENLLADDLAESRPARTDLRPYLAIVSLLLFILTLAMEQRSP